MENVSSSNSQKALVPKLRFPGFEGEWKESSFESLFEILPNNTLSRVDLSSDGEILNIHYGDILIKFGDVLDCTTAEIPFVAAPENLGSKTRYLCDGDIVIADTAEDETVGKTTELQRIGTKKVVAGLHTIPCRPLKKFTEGYLGYYINAPAFHDQLYPLMQGIKVLSISKSNISRTNIRFPVFDEQKKISEILLLLDKRIEVQSRFVEALKSYKRGVLEQLFSSNLSFSGSSQMANIVPLREVFCKISDRNSNGTVHNVVTNSAEFGLLPQRDYFDKDIAVAENTQNYFVIIEGDFVYNPRKSKSAPYGPFNVYRSKEAGIVSPLYTCLRSIADVNLDYLYWYFQSTAWHRYMYDNGSQGVRHDRVSMTDKLLFAIPVVLPDKQLQDKIVAVMSSIQRLYEAEAAKAGCLQSEKIQFLRSLFL